MFESFTYCRGFFKPKHRSFWCQVHVELISHMLPFSIPLLMNPFWYFITTHVDTCCIPHGNLSYLSLVVDLLFSISGCLKRDFLTCKHHQFLDAKPLPSRHWFLLSLHRMPSVFMIASIATIKSRSGTPGELWISRRKRQLEEIWKGDYSNKPFGKLVNFMEL